MHRIVWLTDLHLNFASDEQVDALWEIVVRQEPCAVVISGDIGEATDLIGRLDKLQRMVTAPIYFVLGNHDFYFGQIHEVRRSVRSFCANCAALHYLTASEAFALSRNVGIVGHDGWADARLGDYASSLVQLNDFRLIRDLVDLSLQDRKRIMGMLGDLAAAHLRRVLPAALDRWEHVFAVTHVPPWQEAC